jgi:O-antigen/teichoic acid export membrane protein
LLLTRILAILVFPAIGMVAAAHHPLFKLLLSEKWLPSGSLYMLAAPAAALQAMTAFSGAFMMALGRTDIQLRLNTEFCIVFALALLAFTRLGIAWAVVAYTLTVFLYFPRFLMLTLPHLGCRPFTYLRIIIAPILVTIACTILYIDASRALHANDWLCVLLAGGIAVLGMTTAALTQYRTLFNEIVTFDAIEVFNPL